MNIKSVLHGFVYAPWLIKEIFVSGISLALDSLKPHNGYHPVIVRYPLRITNAWEIFWFTSSITATPGTLSLGLREPPREGLPRIVLVHAVQGDDPAAVVESLAEMELRLAPHVADIDYGVPGQGETTQLDAAFYEYTLETVGRHMRAPDMAEADDHPLAAEETPKPSRSGMLRPVRPAAAKDAERQRKEQKK